MRPLYCPHCAMPVADAAAGPFPPRPAPCPNCRLIIGAGRARLQPDAATGERAHGSAANVLLSRARRDAAVAGDPEAVGAAIRRVAADRLCSPPRLRMLDYAEATRDDPSLPSLSCVLATFGAWKAAARRAELPDEAA